MSSAQLRPNLPDPVPFITAAPVPEPRKPKRRGWIWLLLVGAVVCGAAFWARQANQQSKSKPVAAIRTAKVRTGPIEQTIRLTGMAVAEKASIVTAPMMRGSRRDGDYSLTLRTLAENGAFVKKGDPIAEFDRQYQERRLDDYEAVVAQHERYIKILNAQLQVTRSSQQRKVAQAKAAWDKALLDLKTAPVRSAIAVEKYKLTASEAKTRYDEYQVQLKYLDASEMAAINTRKLDLQQTQLEAQRARNNMEKMMIKAPMDGLTVIQTTHRGTEHAMIQAGDQLAPGAMLMQIVDTRSMVVAGAVNQVDADLLRLGAKTHIHVDAFPDVDLPGKLISIGAFARMGTYRRSFLSEVPVRIKFERMDPRIIPNFSVSADVVLAAKENATIVPRECVFAEAQDKRVAYVRKGQGWERREVEVGLESNTQTEIKSGLRAGEELAAERVPAEMLAAVTQ